MAIHLIRHGETALNAARVLQAPDTPLSENGLDQAARLGARLADEGITRILSSDYARARMTAEAIAATTGIAIEQTPLLRERNFGDLRGRAYADLGFDPFHGDYAPPNGESWTVFHERVDRAWVHVTAAGAETRGHLAVVTHGLVCGSVVDRIVEAGEQDAAAGYGWMNTSLTVLDATPPWTVRLFNCAAHLDHAEAKGPA
ncbi:MAG: histidine phosphatase family protein [Planctomycetota bacterium]|jgi:broad specificity phosphatase PhoE|nr:phosphoglycerate mutase [Deltaproteobacteria bacterium]MDP6539865.1 histidine phosphatase family protein [Planctomycetota bacterium]